MSQFHFIVICTIWLEFSIQAWLEFSIQASDILMPHNDPKTGTVLSGSTLFAIPSVCFEGIISQHNLFVQFFKSNTTAWCLNL